MNINSEFVKVILTPAFTCFLTVTCTLMLLASDAVPHLEPMRDKWRVCLWGGLLVGCGGLLTNLLFFSFHTWGARLKTANVEREEDQTRNAIRSLSHKAKGELLQSVNARKQVRRMNGELWYVHELVEKKFLIEEKKPKEKRSTSHRIRDDVWKLINDCPELLNPST
jgi:hypothetical protein